MSVADELAKLATLRDSGVLSDREFEQQKAVVLGRAVTTAPPRSSSVGAYDLLEVVGEGGMGKVYRARHRLPPMAGRQGGEVAVKLLHPHLASKPGFADRFRDEAKALAALDHPNIVKVFDVVEEAGQLALVMEWVPGRPLSHMIGRETGPIPWDRARQLVGPLLDAVEHAHSRGVVHRDLKPDNIRVAPDGTVKVLDFGIARVGETRGRTKTGTGMGTVDYMAPEQYADAKTVDARADIYALGMTLYEMVAGRLPWEPSDTEFSVLQRKHGGKLPPPTQFYPAIPEWVVEAIGSALNPDPKRRTASVAELRQALLSGGGPKRPPAVPFGDSAAPTVLASDLPMSMNPLWILAGVRGRIGRGQLLWGAILYVGWTMLVVAVADSAISDAVAVVALGLVAWPLIALTAKRAHDVGVSGWVGVGLGIGCAVLIAAGPLAILLALFVFLMFVTPGTNGRNSYGVDRRPPSE